MVRRLASKSLMDNVPDSAMYFVSGIVFLATGAILYYVVGPPPIGSGSSPIIKVFIIGIVVVIFNYYIFAYKERYKKIVDYYNSKYMGRVPWILYFVVPMCYIFLMWTLGRIHDHYGDYYRINGLK
jgi:hypothetical protein